MRYANLRNKGVTSADAIKKQVVEGYNKAQTRESETVDEDCRPITRKGKGAGTWKQWTSNACVRNCFPKHAFHCGSIEKFASRGRGLPAEQRTSSMAASSRMLAEVKGDSSHSHLRNVRCALAEGVCNSNRNAEYFMIRYHSFVRVSVCVWKQTSCNMPKSNVHEHHAYVSAF